LFYQLQKFVIYAKRNEQKINLKLVEEVEKYPVLYNFTLSGYSRKDETEEAWSEVGRHSRTLSYFYLACLWQGKSGSPNISKFLLTSDKNIKI
jgi:hypothetical protein